MTDLSAHTPIVLGYSGKSLARPVFTGLVGMFG